MIAYFFRKLAGKMPALRVAHGQGCPRYGLLAGKMPALLDYSFSGLTESPFSARSFSSRSRWACIWACIVAGVSETVA